MTAIMMECPVCHGRRVIPRWPGRSERPCRYCDGAGVVTEDGLPAGQGSSGARFSRAPLSDTGSTPKRASGLPCARIFVATGVWLCALAGAPAAAEEYRWLLGAYDWPAPVAQPVEQLQVDLVADDCVVRQNDIWPPPPDPPLPTSALEGGSWLSWLLGLVTGASAALAWVALRARRSSKPAPAE